ncbi:hypothetical protein FI667_g5647, partial [Globisporangium splendens]
MPPPPPQQTQNKRSDLRQHPTQNNAQSNLRGVLFNRNPRHFRNGDDGGSKRDDAPGAGARALAAGAGRAGRHTLRSVCAARRRADLLTRVTPADPTREGDDVHASVSGLASCSCHSHGCANRESCSCVEALRSESNGFLCVSALVMQRTETRYVWAQKYAFLRNLYQQGQMPAHVWQEVDAAYDHIYDETRRHLYDFWGPVASKMSIAETQLNVGLFYVIWSAILYSLTTPTQTRDASKWVFTGFILLLCFEVAVKLIHYEPPFHAIFTATTPREFVMWGHRLFPIFAFAVVSVKKVFYIDMEKHRKLQLQHMLQQNERTKSELASIEKALLHDDEDEDDGGERKQDAF